MGARGRVLLASAVLLAGCTTGSRPAAAPAGPTGAPAATGCASRVEAGPLPEWARAGFSGDARMPHVLGAQGDIVAALFGHPLTVGRREGPSNKILWVARPVATPPATTAPATLEITATLVGTDTRVTREVVGGPGPSIIDLPQAGCWHLVLQWSGRTDTMDLVYADS